VAHLRAVRLLHANDVVRPLIEAGRHLDARDVDHPISSQSPTRSYSVSSARGTGIGSPVPDTAK
jgi:hypothetical protein